MIQLYLLYTFHVLALVATVVYLTLANMQASTLSSGENDVSIA